MAARSHTPHTSHVARGKFTHAHPRGLACLTAVVTGLGTAAVFIPVAVAATAPAAGTVFIADTGHGQVVQVPPGGTQSTVPTTGLSQPTGVAVDAAGDVYIADRNSKQVVEVTPAGVQTTVPATGLDYPFGVAVDAAGDVYIADAIGQQVVEVTPAGVQTTVPAIGLAYPTGVAVDAAGDVYIADTNTTKVVEVTPTGVQTTVPATGLSRPTGVAVDAAGDVYIADTNTSKVVEVTPAGVQTTVPATGLNGPFGVAVDAAGDVYITDLGNSRVVKVTPAGVQTTVGTGLNEPFGVAVYSPVTADNTTVGLTSSTGAPLAGGVVSYYAGGWHTLGTTDSSGAVAADVPNGSYSFAMTYQGTRQQLNNVAVDGTSTGVVFHTAAVAVNLIDNSGNPLAAGSASYYAAGWHAIGATDGTGVTTVQMLPGSYSFAMTYNGTRQQLNNQKVSGTSSTVAFQTSDVAVNLVDNSGHPLVAGSASYYAAGWHAIGATDSTGVTTVQMLPGSYSFAMTYQGTRQQLNTQPVAGASSTVGFQTTLVNVQASDHTITVGSNIVGADASYYAGGWHAVTIVNANNHKMRMAQMLPGTYSFADVYSGARQQKNGVAIGTGNAQHIQSVYFGF